MKSTNKNSRERNPRAYERYRGKDGTKCMSYYLPEDIITLLNIKAAREGKTKSELVLEGIKYILRDEIPKKDIIIVDEVVNK